MHKQRSVTQESFNLRKDEVFWLPRVERDGKLGTAKGLGKAHWYAVVDDIAEDTVVLQIASWPRLDRGGHLRFDRIYEHSFPLDVLQQLINKERTRHVQPAPDRSLRTGDAFLIEDEDPPNEKMINPEFQGSILDITAAAREQAKIAMYSAVTRRLNPDEASNRMKSSKK